MDVTLSVIYGLLLLLTVVATYQALIGRRRFSHIVSLKGKHVVITGGSSGIGLCMAMQCAAEGAYLTLIARNLSKLQDAQRQVAAAAGVSPDTVNLKSADVSNAEASAAAIRESFEWRPIDVLVCSAGIVEANFMEDIKPSRIEEIVRINILGCIFPIQTVIPLMKSRSKEHPSSIVIIGSLSACVFLYGANVYTATKSALKGLAELLKFELLPFGIGITFSCPGFTQTPMLEEVEEDASGFIELGRHIYLGAFREYPEDVARQTIEGLKRDEFLVCTTGVGRMVRVLGRGFVAPESPVSFLVELALIAPLRFLTYLWLLNAKKVLLMHGVPKKKLA